ncbi:MAG: DUF4097 family beta strand repeat-containing protein [Solirubrobacterales bacterium]
MDRNLKIILIALWTIIAVFLSGILVYNIISDRTGENMFSLINKSETKKVEKQENSSTADIKKIFIDCKSEDISVFSTDEGEIKVIEKSNRNLKETQKFQMSKQGETLMIEQPSTITFNLFGINFTRKLEVYIPKKYMDSLEISSLSGNVTIEDDMTLSSINVKQHSGSFLSKGTLNSDNIELYGSSGSIKSAGITSKTWRCEITSGDMVLNNVTGSGYAKCSSGKINITFNNVGDFEDIQGSSGDINIYVPVEENFNFEGSCSSGEINSDFSLSYKNKNHEAALSGNNTNKKITAKVSSGDINLLKAKQ